MKLKGKRKGPRIKSWSPSTFRVWRKERGQLKKKKKKATELQRVISEV